MRARRRRARPDAGASAVGEAGCGRVGGGRRRIRARRRRARQEDAGRSYRLVFHERHRELVVDSYLPHVCCEGRALMIRNRRRKLFTNTGDRYNKSPWNSVAFEHPSTFETLAMDPAKKREIMDDLDAFQKGKEYYARICKPWKRGHLLYGPPGTGKSTMIAAMANYRRGGVGRRRIRARRRRAIWV